MAKVMMGYARTILWDSPGVPLAGHVTRRDRLAQRVLDPLHVTAAVLAEGERRIALVAVDLLIAEDGMVAEVSRRLEEQGIGALYFNASHSHSAIGGFVSAPGGHYFMGRYQDSIRSTLIDRIVEAVSQAAQAVVPVVGVRFGQVEVPGLTMNRRVTQGPVDDFVQTLEFRFEDAQPILIVSSSGHPVIVSCTSQDSMSADFPGRVVSKVESLGMRCLFLSGSLGGLNVLFPEMPIGLETHLEFISQRIFQGIKEAQMMQRMLGVPRPSFREVRLEGLRQAPPTPSGAPSMGKAFRGLAFSAVGRFYSRSMMPERLSIPVTVLRLGPVALVGMPADFGVQASLSLKEALRRDWNVEAIVTSHTNGFAGYVHLAQEYQWSPESRTDMFTYENAMNWFGADLGDRLNAAAAELVGKAP